MKTSIYVVTHKSFNADILDLDRCYKIIAVGNNGNTKQTDLLTDSQGENIAQKNRNYCELTAQYWYWKNDTESDVVGLCHYRRYFTKYSISKSFKGILKQNEIEDILSKYDIIVSEKEYSYRGAYRAYLDCGYEKDLAILEEVMSLYYPEYMPEYRKYFKDSSGNFVANMYISSKKISDKYCEWLFQVLSEVEKRVDISNYSVQEARIFGYMSERLLAVWLYHNKYRIKQMRVINTENQVSFTWYIKELLRKVKIYQGIKRLIWKFRRG